MKFNIKIFVIFLLSFLYVPSIAYSEKFVCKDNQNKLFIKFEHNNKKVHSANKEIYKYNLKEDLIIWNSFTEIKNHKIVRTFNFDRNSRKLSIDTDSIVYGLNKKYLLTCQEMN